MHKIIAIVGPTASGKSDLGVTLARRFDGEVVSADSRQVYKGLDIGSGKITKREMHGVPHHMLDVASPRVRYTAARYVRDATKAVKNILKRNRLPIIVGGTGLYVDSLITGQTFPEVPPDAKLRDKLEKLSTEKLFALLTKKDPHRAKDIDIHNRRRLIRALEIVETQGAVPHLDATEPRYDALWIGLKLPFSELEERIEKRLTKRLRGGVMLKEVEGLRKDGLSWKRLDELGLEYRFVSRYLRGLITKDEMHERIVRESIKYAKRQITWWKRNKGITWIAPNDEKKAERLVERFLKG